VTTLVLDPLTRVEGHLRIELDIEGAKPLCIRILMHVTTERPRAELHHIYLEGAANLRDDLPS